MIEQKRLLNKMLVGDGCWLWIAATDTHGYGVIRSNYILMKAHRAVYEFYVGPIPSGLDLDHLCRNRSCVRPDHMEPVTRQTNIRRGAGNGGTEWDGNHYNNSKTHCLSGHPFSEENTRLWRTHRICRTCARLRARRYAQAER